MRDVLRGGTPYRASRLRLHAGHAGRITLRAGFRSLVIAALLCCGLGAPAFAAAEDGLAAYGRGDYATAYRELAPAAASGDAVAQYMLARMYFTGAGVARDLAEGLKWL